MNVTTIGLDLAKNVFHVVCFDSHGKEIKKRMLRRNQVAKFFVNVPPCRVSMEACASSHYWGHYWDKIEIVDKNHDNMLFPNSQQGRCSNSGLVVCPLLNCVDFSPAIF